MQTIIGTLLDVTPRQREWEGRTWTEHTAHILTGIETVMVTLQGPSRDGTSAGLPAATVLEQKGSPVALEVYARSSNNTKRVYYTATRLLSSDDLADALGLVSV